MKEKDIKNTDGTGKVEKCLNFLQMSYYICTCAIFAYNVFIGEILFRNNEKYNIYILILPISKFCKSNYNEITFGHYPPFQLSSQQTDAILQGILVVFI